MRATIIGMLLISSAALAGRGGSTAAIQSAVRSGSVDAIVAELERAEFLACTSCIDPVRALVDRVEWVVMPDPATASAALQNGEVDWWENPITDLVPILRRNRNIQVDIADPLGNIGSFRMNHLHPPFNNLKVRQAVMTALSQEDYMRALVGDDNNLWKTMGGFFTPGTPLYSEEGGEMMKAANLERGKQLLRESGYAGEPVICVVAQDQPITKAQGDVTADLLKRIGFNVDFVATDWGTVGQRRAMKNPLNQGGWSMFHTWFAGADCVNPATQIWLRANGDGAWFGWPNIPSVEAAVAEWYDAPDLEAEKAVIRRLNRAAFENVVRDLWAQRSAAVEA